jgi:hypothetical protein
MGGTAIAARTAAAGAAWLLDDRPSRSPNGVAELRAGRPATSTSPGSTHRTEGIGGRAGVEVEVAAWRWSRQGAGAGGRGRRRERISDSGAG